MDEITIEAQLNLPDLVQYENPDEGIQAIAKRLQSEYGIKAVSTDVENGIPVFELTAPKKALEAFIAKEFEGGEYNIDDFVKGALPAPGEEPGDLDGEAVAEGTDADKDPMSEEGIEADVVDTSDGTNLSEEDTIVKTLGGLDEQARNRILARFSGAAPKTGDTSVEGTALAKVIKGLKY